MTPSERERATDSLARTRERLLGVVRSLSPDQLQYKPAPDRWSVAECLEHLTTVEGRILGFIQKALERPVDSSKRPAMDDEALLRMVADRGTRAKAPEPVIPVGRWPLDVLLLEFEAARTRSLEFAASTNADLRQHFHAHPRFGELDCYQWLLLIGAHGDRHRAQAEEVLAAAGFPQSAATA